MRKIILLSISLVVMTAVCFSNCAVSYAVMPPSTVLEEETHPKDAKSRLAGIIEKLEQRKEEDARFIENIENELKELKA